jgi:hypothetical protein
MTEKCGAGDVKRVEWVIEEARREMLEEIEERSKSKR